MDGSNANGGTSTYKYIESRVARGKLSKTLDLGNPHPRGNYREKKKKKNSFSISLCLVLSQMAGIEKKMMKEVGEKQAKERG